MELPLEYKFKIESRLENIKLSTLKEHCSSLTERYLNNSGNGDTFIKNETDALIYASFRMPATYGAISDALKHAFENLNENIESMIDIGAGTGSATLAAVNYLNIKNSICLEDNEHMEKVGKYLLNDLKEVASYKKFNLLKDELNDRGDLVISSYVLNELSEDKRRNVILDLWNATNKVLLIVEPGTPFGYSIIKQARDVLIKEGGNLIAPCPHMEACPLNKGDWCHFTTRISRSKFHKLIKGGDSPFEDEKYSYIAFSKCIANRCDSRILRHPEINKGFVKLVTCSKDGVKEVTISKKENERFKKAKKSKAGDNL